MNENRWLVWLAFGVRAGAAGGCGGKKVAKVEEPALAVEAPKEAKPAEKPAAKPAEAVAPTLDPIYFEFGSYHLTYESQTILAKYAEAMLTIPSRKILIEGHGDDRGAIEYNASIGQKRADAARDFLVSYGVAVDQITTASYGESRPLVVGIDEATWAQNRRVEFRARD